MQDIIIASVYKYLRDAESMRCDLYSWPSHGTTFTSFDSPWLHR